MRLATLVLASIALVGCGNTTEFIAYSGAQQKWPTAAGAMVDTKLAVPVYYGFPPRPYAVLGELRSQSGEYWSASNAQASALKDAADEAKKKGADAIIAMSSEASVSRYLGGGTVIGNSVLTSSSGVQTAHVRVQAIKFL